MICIYLFLLPLIKCDTTKDDEYYYDHSSYTPNHSQRSFLERILPSFPNQFSKSNAPTIDPDVVYNGVLDPNNIAIHVGQNFVNFAAGSVAWFLLSFTFQERTKRSASRSFPQSPIPITIKAPPPNAFSAEDFLNQYYNNYQNAASEDSSFTRSQRVLRSTDDQMHGDNKHNGRKTNEETMSMSKHLASMFRSLADAADSFDR